MIQDPVGESDNNVFEEESEKLSVTAKALVNDFPHLCSKKEK